MQPTEEQLKRYGLLDWDIIVIEKDSSNDDTLGQSHIEADYSQALIYLYLDDIEAKIKVFPNESKERVLEHELCEVAIDADFSLLPDYIKERADVIRVADIIAERLRRLVARAREEGRREAMEEKRDASQL